MSPSRRRIPKAQSSLRCQQVCRTSSRYEYESDVVLARLVCWFSGRGVARGQNRTKEDDYFIWMDLGHRLYFAMCCTSA